MKNGLFTGAKKGPGGKKTKCNTVNHCKSQFASKDDTTNPYIKVCWNVSQKK